jgi:hypothetical protein
MLNAGGMGVCALGVAGAFEKPMRESSSVLI